MAAVVSGRESVCYLLVKIERKECQLSRSLPGYPCLENADRTLMELPYHWQNAWQLQRSGAMEEEPQIGLISLACTYITTDSGQLWYELRY